jgi:hypothetical protein
MNNPQTLILMMRVIIKVHTNNERQKWMSFKETYKL